MEEVLEAVIWQDLVWMLNHSIPFTQSVSRGMDLCINTIHRSMAEERWCLHCRCRFSSAVSTTT